MKRDDYVDLVKELRRTGPFDAGDGKIRAYLVGELIAHPAADAIESLIAERDELRAENVRLRLALAMATKASVCDELHC